MHQYSNLSFESDVERTTVERGLPGTTSPFVARKTAILDGGFGKCIDSYP